MTHVYKLDNLCCANCANKIERNLSKLPFVSECNINFMTQKMIVETNAETTKEALDENISTIINKIDKDINLKKIK